MPSTAYCPGKRCAQRPLSTITVPLNPISVRVSRGLTPILEEDTATISAATTEHAYSTAQRTWYLLGMPDRQWYPVRVDQILNHLGTILKIAPESIHSLKTGMLCKKIRSQLGCVYMCATQASSSQVVRTMYIHQFF